MQNSAIHPRIALVLGATGSLGAAAARALQAHGWRVRALHRRLDRARALPAVPSGIDWLNGDAMRADDVRAAANGVTAIIHAVNPPHYRRWRELAIPMLANTIEAAATSGARLIFPGNVYNFGPDAGAVVDETSPQNPLTRKGCIRVEMEAMLQAASENGRLRAMVIRAGDFFGGTAANSWFAKIIVPAEPGAPIRYPGSFGAGHAWAYVPDLAETMAKLIEMERSLPAWEVVHFGGHWLERGVEMAEAVQRVVGGGSVIRPFSWLPFRLLSPFSPFLREVLEMRYLWHEPLRLASDRLHGLIGEEPHTPLDEAVGTAVAALGRTR